MDDAAIALIGAAAGLIGATFGSVVALRIARVESRERSSGELAAAVAAFGYAVDRLMLEIGQLPPPPGRAATALSTRVARMPHTNWFTGQLARWSLGLPAMRALDGLMAAASRLSLVAPEALLPDVGLIPDLLGRLAQRDQEAVCELAGARARLLAASRAELGLRPRRRWRSVLMRARIARATAADRADPPHPDSRGRSTA